MKAKAKNSITFKSGKVMVKYELISEKEEETGLYTGFIPAFDLCFTAKSETDVHSLSKTMIKSFFAFWLKKQGVKQFGLEIVKLGFRAEKMHDVVVKNLIHGLRVDASFKSESNVNFSGKKSQVLEEVFANG